MNKYQTLASNTIILAIGQFGSKILVYFMLKFYTSMLGADGFGDVNNIINASSLLISVVTLSINEGVLRYALDKGNNGKHVLSIGLNTAIVGLVLFAAAVPLIGFIDMLAEYKWLIYMYVATGSIKGICAIYVRARGHVKLFAVDGIITTISVILLNLLLLGVFKLGVVGYILSVSLADLISIVFLSIKAKLYKQYRPLGNDPVLAKSMIYKAFFVWEIKLQILRRNDIVRAKNFLHRPLIKQCSVMREQISAVMTDSNIVRGGV